MSKNNLTKVKVTSKNFPKFNPTKLEKCTQKTHLFLLFVAFFIAQVAKSEIKKEALQLRLSAGIHTFYAPIQQLKWENPAVCTAVEIHYIFNEKQTLSAGFQLQYTKQNYQGNALGTQLLVEYSPLLFRRIELGIASGIGYRFSGYPSPPYRWENATWKPGKGFEGMVQIPLMASIGYNAISFYSTLLTPFISAQLNAMLGYNPDFNPLPDTSLSFGVKIQFAKN